MGKDLSSAATPVEPPARSPIDTPLDLGSNTVEPSMHLSGFSEKPSLPVDHWFRLFLGLEAIALIAWWARVEEDPIGIMLIGLSTLLSVGISFAWKQTRFSHHLLAATQMLLASFFVQALHGHPESHFIFLLSLIILAVFLDWRIVLTGGLVALGDHFFREFWGSLSSYGTPFTSGWIWVEHGGWILLTTGALSIVLFVARRSGSQSNEEGPRTTSNMAKMATLGEMTGSIAHEINNPIAVIQGYSTRIRRLLARGNPDPQKVDHLADRIETHVNRIVRIVSSLRNFSRDGSQDDFRVESVGSLLEEVIELSQARFKNMGVDFRYSGCDPSLDLECQAVPLCQVFINLLNNAIDAVSDEKKGLPKNERWVEVTVQGHEEMVQFEVTDSGGGIPLEIRSKMMSPFFTTKGAGKGTGLGFRITIEILAHHHGTIRYDERCETTRFLVSLPRRQPKLTPKNVSLDKISQK